MSAAHAQAYAEAGLSVLPLYEPTDDGRCSCGDPSCSSPGKHPRTQHGVHDATTDAERIAEWWDRWPTANVGIATERLLVLDVDPRNGGDPDRFREFETLTANTGGGGEHRIFRLPDGAKVANKQLAPGVDVKSDGGYIVAPPSRHASGGSYAWVDGQDPRTTPIARAPRWILNELSSPPPAEPRETPVTLISGERNNGLCRLAGKLRRVGLTVDEIRAAVLTANANRCRPPLSDREVERTILKSAERWEPGELAVHAAPTVFGVSEIFAPLPPVNWLAKELDICPGPPTLFAGYGFSRKSLALQDLALSVASDRPAWGYLAVRQGRALHLDYEQGSRLTFERYQRLARATELAASDIGDRLSYVAFPGFTLDSDDAEPELAQLCDGFDLVIVDSFRAACPSIEENSSEARRPLDMMARVSEHTGTVFIVIHHARKPSRDSVGGARMAIRGSGALYDAPASVVIFEAEKGQPTRVLHEKARTSGILAGDLMLDAVDVTIDGNPRGGLLVTAERASETPAEQEAGARLDALKERIRGFLLEHGEVAGKGALRQRLGVNRDQLFAAVAELEHDGELVNRGTERRPRLALMRRSA